MKQSRSIPWLIAAFVIGALVMAGLGALLVNIQGRKAEAAQYPLRIVQISNTDLDPAVWGKNFPREYDSFVKTKEDKFSSPYGGSVPFDRLEKFPALKRIWAPYAFSVDYNEERGHYWAQIDQRDTKRQQVVAQPGACANCHAAEAPQLIAQMGWANFNKTPWKEMGSKFNLGSSCADCHDPQTLELRLTRPALINALKERGIDWTQASRQEMRTYVCAQCHVEYYFKGDDKILTFPWSNGYTAEDIEAHYAKYEFKDWVHKETGAPMLKVQHPEFEMSSTGIHARSGVTCADCHMPYVREGALKVSDHWIRSPLQNLDKACLPCHRQSEEEMEQRVLTIQKKTADLLRASESAQLDAIDAIVAALKSGASDPDLAKAREFHRKATFYWDYVAAENSTGFHSPQEAARVLALSLNYARQAQVEALKVTKK
ncbi:MAG: ammonia-forming cytochrome c nitrite reductase subunit c552 [Anaerolineales bacterium]|nr:ammonia-forming cytochrome c nitrite reductase subunit c552 [Anaerolineales bacterium]